MGTRVCLQGQPKQRYPQKSFQGGDRQTGPAVGAVWERGRLAGGTRVWESVSNTRLSSGSLGDAVFPAGRLGKESAHPKALVSALVSASLCWERARSLAGCREA